MTRTEDERREARELSDGEDKMTIEPPLLMYDHNSGDRYWDPVRAAYVTRITPGRFVLARGAEAVVTRVGVGMCVCARDPGAGIGGLAHFILPAGHEIDNRWDGTAVSAMMRYGNVAMEYLVTAVCKAGGERHRIELMIFGGARLAGHLDGVADRHIEFIHAYAETEKMPIVNQDIGDDYAREVAVYPGVGTAQVSTLTHTAAEAILANEVNHMNAIESASRSGEVILF